MKLLRLLRTGKSLVGSKDAARYQMGDPRAMPVFESKVAEESKVQSPKSKVVPAAERKGWFGRLVAGFGRLFSKTQKRAIPQFNKPAVQGELSLERVKVMRNDLSDTDLEVVPAKTARPKDPVEAKPTAKTSEESKANSSLTTTTPLTLALSPADEEREGLGSSKLQASNSKQQVPISGAVEREVEAVEVGGG